MKKTLIALALALGTVAAHAENTTTLWSDMTDTIKVSTALPHRLDVKLPDSIRLAEQAAKLAPLDYTPGEGKTYYFDAKGNKAEKPVQDGYYRKILGKTADGRTVVQDFYQDSDKAQIAPSILRKGAAEDDFSGDLSDSTLVNYNRDGSVSAIVPLQDGKATGHPALYHNGVLVAQAPLPEGGSDANDPFTALAAYPAHGRMFYPDGTLMAIFPSDDGKDAGIAFWRADGSLLMSQRKQGDKDDATFWSTDGKALEKGSLAEMKAAQDMQALLPQLEQAIKLQEQLP
jgi:hypothetical protein